tara:strand:- start:422 stop:613 length:192 start_codon:yes stop_codon:yes gene_type:complete
MRNKNLEELIRHQIGMIDLLRITDRPEDLNTAVDRLEQLLSAIPENAAIPKPLENCSVCNKEE